MKHPPRSSIRWAAWQRSLRVSRTGDVMCSQVASESGRADGEEQQQSKPWGGSLYWESGRMDIAQNQRETVLFLRKKGQIRGWTGEATRTRALAHTTSGRVKMSSLAVTQGRWNKGGLSKGTRRAARCLSRSLGPDMENWRIWSSIGRARVWVGHVRRKEELGKNRSPPDGPEMSRKWRLGPKCGLKGNGRPQGGLPLHPCPF